ncbi:MAG: hypothetical protein GY845_25645 [Planctomycetes bacterium]|nr:hypothetical protein [Planctomycetota bacterium]
MIAEQITITTTFTSVKDLIESNRIGTLGNTKCVGIKLTYADTIVITMKEEGTVIPVTILDGTNSITSAEFKTIDFDKVLLKTASSTADVNLVVEQDRI